MKSFKEIYIDDVEQFNKILESCKYKYEVESPQDVYKSSFYIDFQVIQFKLYVKYNTTLPQCYIFRMDGSKSSEFKESGKKAFSQLQKMSNNFIVDYGTNEYKGILWDEWNAIKGKPIWNCGYRKAILYFNKKFNNTRTPNCICYDINSAREYAMCKDMPDVSKPFRHEKVWDYENSLVKEDEIGFKTKDDELVLVESGKHAEYIFKRVKSPFIKFVNHYFELKKEATINFKNAKTEEEKEKYLTIKRINKNYMNYAVGYILRKNPFIYSAILSYENEYTRSFMDENTMYSNTDSIASCVHRKDIEKLLGNNLGQFKIEHEGNLAILNGSYQWNNDKPSYRGISKQWFKEDFDLLKDEIPNNDENKYRFNREELRIELNQ